MINPYKILLIAQLISLAIFHQTINASPIKPEIQLATVYQQPADINQYWISEKLDGVRAYWDGNKLYFRSGKVIASPDWFTQHWPNQALDGELWFAREQFNQTSACVRKYQPSACWRQLKFMTFDLPKHQGTFNQRVSAMKQLVQQSNSQYLDMVKQFTCPDIDCLNRHYEQVVVNGGEGLMLHLGNAHYYKGRTPNLMKLKPFLDSEAIVVAHLAGKGKYQGKLGAIRVKTPTGIEFNIGSGFSDLERSSPPAIGSTITFKYSGKTHKGVPRFASFVRIREQ